MRRIKKEYKVRGGVDQDDWQRRAMAYERRREEQNKFEARKFY